MWAVRTRAAGSLMTPSANATAGRARAGGAPRVAPSLSRLGRRKTGEKGQCKNWVGGGLLEHGCVLPWRELVEQVRATVVAFGGGFVLGLLRRPGQALRMVASTTLRGA
jgi:hypothetical protein